ncbi:hypothetical protein HK57_00538 [Aspergillus ustus]|uniref:FAD-binding PCMH-type domain-containing protein n=1 Tax=Aspergillus ustus TaxID=40382 RepID=A0A0C1E2C4_ASPUT|nr:hypothetical protein HK57_00538 [Aspergillus ustus]
MIVPQVTGAMMLAAALVNGVFSTTVDAPGQCGLEAQAQCCDSLRASDAGDRVFVYGDIEYLKAKRSYYSVTTSLNSACIVLPQTAADVSTVVTTLTQPDLAPSCPFAVRSGGHSMIIGASDIVAGVTIDMSWINATVFHPETETASIGPGARWESVYETLQPLQVMVSGGRLGTVGVGGFLTGGGITIYSAQRGLACDDVVAFEIVLANGTITRATNDTNPDLFHVLKGGSGNLGIVTSIEMRAFPQGEIWGGYATYDNSSTPELARALSSFTSNIEQDPRALLVTFWTYDTITNVNRAANAMYYTEPVDHVPAAFHEYSAIENVSSTTHNRPLRDLVNELPDSTNGFRVLFNTLAFRSDPRVIEHGVGLYNELLQNLNSTVSGGDWIIIAGFQPMPILFGTSGLDNGGDIIGLKDQEGDLIVLLLEGFWQHVADDELFNRLADQMIRDLDAFARSVGQGSDFLYLNYAARWQDPLRGYGPENLDLLRQAAQRYDPTGVFQTQVPGGFKVSKADGGGGDE